MSVGEHSYLAMAKGALIGDHVMILPIGMTIFWLGFNGSIFVYVPYLLSFYMNLKKSSILILFSKGFVNLCYFDM